MCVIVWLGRGDIITELREQCYRERAAAAEYTQSAPNARLLRIIGF